MSDSERHKEISGLLLRHFGASPAWGSVQSCGTAGQQGDQLLLHFFPVDNTKAQEDPVIREVMSTIETLARDEEYIHKEVRAPAPHSSADIIPCWRQPSSHSVILDYSY